MAELEASLPSEFPGSLSYIGRPFPYNQTKQAKAL